MKIKKLLFAVVLFFTFSTVYADNTTVSVKDKDGNDLTVAPGETVDMYLYIDYSSVDIDPGDPEDETSFASLGIEGYSGLIPTFQFNIQLPEGFEYVGSPVFVDGVCNYPETEKFDGSNGVYICTNDTHWDDGVLLIKKGAFLKFQIKASSATASDDPYTGQISEFFITDGGWNSVYGVESGSDPVSFNIYVKEATAETVEIALGNASGYNTYVSDKDLDFTGLDAKAYIVSAVSSTEATLKAVTTIKAGEGFIIEGAGEGTIEVPVAAETPAASGTLLATGQPSEGDYLLAKDGTAFVKWNGEGNLAATKAYLPASAISSGAKIINIAFGESTGISEVKKSEADGAIYNLSGMRVSKTQKGVYIMNGRKVIVK